MYHHTQLQSKEKETIAALGGIMLERRKVGRKSDTNLIRSNTVLFTLESENKVRIAAHLIHRNTALSKLASENKERTNLCLTTHTYYLHSHSLNHQHSSFNTRILSK